MKSVAHWDTKVRSDPKIDIIEIDHFDARGMRRVYGRGDYFHRVYNLDIWRDRNKHLFGRFWSRSVNVFDLYFKIIGMRSYPIPEDSNTSFDERWVPKCLREFYDIWIDDNL